MALNFRRGDEAFEAYERPSKQTAFVKDIRWIDNGERKYIKILNPISELVTVDLHEFVPVGLGTKKSGATYTKYESFIDRRDPAIGENSDDLTDRLEHQSKKRTLATAIELEPIVKKVNGRERPIGFSVKTETFTRTNDDEETEEVEAPVIGMITQSKYNFFGYLGSYDETNGPIEEIPFEVTRRGKGPETQYDFVPLVGKDVDYTGLVDNIGNVNYLRDIAEEFSDLPEDKAEASAVIGNAYLNKRLAELADDDRYERFVSGISYIPNRFGPSKSKSQEDKNEVSGVDFDAIIPQSTESKVQRVRKQYAV